MSSRWTITPIHSVDGRGIEPRLPDCKSGVFPLDQQPVLFDSEVCPGIEPGLPAYHAGVLPKHLQTVFSVIPDGLEPSLSCMSRRRLRLWTTGSVQVIEVGVEPTNSSGSRPDRFASLRTRPCCWWRVRELHPTSEAHEAPRSAGSTRKLQAPESNRVTDLMKVSSVPTGLHHH